MLRSDLVALMAAILDAAQEIVASNGAVRLSTDEVVQRAVELLNGTEAVVNSPADRDAPSARPTALDIEEGAHGRH